MKNFKFYLGMLVVMATLFVACEPNDEPGKGSGNGSGNETAEMVVAYIDANGTEQVLAGGETITVTEGGFEMVAHFTITNNAKRPVEFTINEIRRFDENAMGSAMCFNTCIMGNSDASQLWETTPVNPGVAQTADYHLYLNEAAGGTYTTNSEADLIFSDGTTEVKVLVKFVL